MLIDRMNVSFAKTKEVVEGCMEDFSWVGLIESSNAECRSLPFAMEELSESLSRAHDAAVGRDDIDWRFLERLLRKSLQLLLELFNNIWTGGRFPDLWGQSFVVPVPEPESDDSDPGGCNPVSLTICLCGAVEGVVSKG